jgi:nucleobase:cation symporter-1, NCS1 family
VLLRKKDLADTELYDSRGRYGSIRWSSMITLVVATAIGWGLVTNATVGFTWLGYLFGPEGAGGFRDAWQYSNLGVLVALVIGFAGYLVFGRTAVRLQESR